MNLQDLIKFAESSSAPVINIYVGDKASVKTETSSEGIESLSKQVENTSKSWDESRSSVDENTSRQIKDHLNILQDLLRKARAVDSTAETGRQVLRKEMDKVRETVSDLKQKSLESLENVKMPDRYNPITYSSPKGILGVEAQPNDGSGTSMNAHTELLNRLTHRSMMGNPGLDEVRKIRSQDPEQPYE